MLTESGVDHFAQQIRPDLQMKILESRQRKETTGNHTGSSKGYREEKTNHQS